VRYKQPFDLVLELKKKTFLIFFLVFSGINYTMLFPLLDEAKTTKNF
jgi:hypothetical protein